MAKVDPIAEFREDHRKVRDGLLDLIDALQSKDAVEARKILGKINALAGPHFRTVRVLFFIVFPDSFILNIFRKY